MENNKPCPYCDELSYKLILCGVKDEKDREYSLHLYAKAKTLTLNYGDDYDGEGHVVADHVIQYCPNCGRKL